MPNERFVPRLVRSLVITVVNLVVIAAVIGGVLYLAFNQGTDIDDGSWLVVDLSGELPEYTPRGASPPAC